MITHVIRSQVLPGKWSCCLFKTIFWPQNARKYELMVKSLFSLVNDHGVSRKTPSKVSIISWSPNLDALNRRNVLLSLLISQMTELLFDFYNRICENTSVATSHWSQIACFKHGPRWITGSTARLTSKSETTEIGKSSIRPDADNTPPTAP